MQCCCWCSLKTRDKIVSRLESAKAKYPMGDAFASEFSQRSGKSSLRWEVDQAIKNRLKNLEGAYVPKTDLPKSKNPSSAGGSAITISRRQRIGG